MKMKKPTKIDKLPSDERAEKIIKLADFEKSKAANFLTLYQQVADMVYPLNEVITLNKQGWFLKDIARKFGVHPNILGQRLKHEGIRLIRPRRRFHG